MPSVPITSWQIEGEDMEAVTDFIFSGSMITEDGNSSHEIKKPDPVQLPVREKGASAVSSTPYLK